MKRLLTIGLTILALSFLRIETTAQKLPDQTKNHSKKSFVLLELFTSEGCPTCPPADANLAFLEREQPFADTEVVTLALHVDYWNSVNWKDAYSSPVFSRRQQIYSQALKVNQSYTPQMIVDGRIEFTGNNIAKAQRAILEAAKTPKARIEIAAAAAADKYTIKISDVPAHENATVFLAVTESGLASNRKGVTQFGTDAGQTSIVRSLSSLGMLTAAQTNLELETALQINSEWKRENLKIVVFVQENASRKILGVGRMSQRRETIAGSKAKQI